MIYHEFQASFVAFPAALSYDLPDLPAPIIKFTIVKTLPAEGAGPNARTDEYTVLARAAEQGYIDIVRILVKAGAEVNPMNEYPALFYAAMRGQTTVVKVLLEAGAEVNATRFSRAALVIAADRGHTDTVQALLDAGADVNNSRYYNQ